MFTVFLKSAPPTSEKKYVNVCLASANHRKERIQLVIKVPLSGGETACYKALSMTETHFSYRISCLFT